MKRPALILLILLLAAAITLGLLARQEEAVPAMAQTAATTVVPSATSTEMPTEAPTPTLTATPEPTEAPTPEAVGGEMTLTVPGYRSDVTVSITVDGNGVITAMTVDASGEDAGLGKKCEKDNWLEQFIGRTAPFALTAEAAEGMNAVDAVSYATITSRAVIDAVNTLLGVE